jgi:hypothetical protein
MLLNIILSILTATYSLVSPTSVEQIGVAPKNATHSFERTATSGLRGQMTTGNSTRLTLAGWENTTIRSIVLEMHSNSSSGAGSLTVQIGNQFPWIINDCPFSAHEWGREYSTKWITIQKDMMVTVNEGDLIEITISATENSLYINSYTIIYESIDPMFYTIDFVTGLDTVPASITQNNIEEPIILPEWKDTLNWFFMGWCSDEIIEQDTTPLIYKPGEEYTPTSDCILWAVYTDDKQLCTNRNYQSGKYILTMHNELTVTIAGSGMAMNGKIENSTIPVTSVDMYKTEDKMYVMNTCPTSNMIYDIEFNNDSTLIIKHTLSGEYIGYKADKLSATPSLWNYRVITDGSIVIYYTYSDKFYTLYIGLNSYDIVACSQRLNIDIWQTDALWLFPINSSKYTSKPLGRSSGLDDILYPQPNTDNIIWNIGTFQLLIKDGKKYLQIR